MINDDEIFLTITKSKKERALVRVNKISSLEVSPERELATGL